MMSAFGKPRDELLKVIVATMAKVYHALDLVWQCFDAAITKSQADAAYTLREATK